MEPGIYSVIIEVYGYGPYIVNGIEVVAGEIVNLNDITGPIFLTPSDNGGVEM